MLEFNFIKNLHLTLIKFGGDKKIEVASGDQSKGVLVLPSTLATDAINLSENAGQSLPKSKHKQLKNIHKVEVKNGLRN